MPSTATDAAYDACITMAQNHYENFPVASVLLPRRMRRPIAAIYAFARSADDFADEGDLDPEERLRRLDGYTAKLTALQSGDTPADPIFIALADAIQSHNLPFQPFFDLLSAFRQDVTVHNYASFDELLDYCRRSANPVGRLLLHLFGSAREPYLSQSDAVCTALQLINFLQDLQPDYQKGRVYLPQDEMTRLSIHDAMIPARHYTPGWRQLIDQQITRIGQMLDAGAPLGRALPGRAGLEIRATIAGGRRVLDKLRHQNTCGFIRQARLGVGDWVRIAWQAL